MCPCAQAVDIWSVGCIFAEVLLGKPLFPGRDAVSQLQLITDLLGKPAQHTINRIGNEKARAFLQAMPPKAPKPFAHNFTNASAPALALLQRLLAFDPADRPSAAEALADPYFASLPPAMHQDPAHYNRQVVFDFELHKLETHHVRALIYEEVRSHQAHLSTRTHSRKQLLYRHCTACLAWSLFLEGLVGAFVNVCTLTMVSAGAPLPP